MKRRVPDHSLQTSPLFHCSHSLFFYAKARCRRVQDYGRLKQLVTETFQDCEYITVAWEARSQFDLSMTFSLQALYQSTKIFKYSLNVSLRSTASPIISRSTWPPNQSEFWNILEQASWVRYCRAEHRKAAPILLSNQLLLRFAKTIGLSRKNFIYLLTSRLFRLATLNQFHKSPFRKGRRPLLFVPTRRVSAAPFISHLAFCTQVTSTSRLINEKSSGFLLRADLKQRKLWELSEKLNLDNSCFTENPRGSSPHQDPTKISDSTSPLSFA